MPTVDPENIEKDLDFMFEDLPVTITWKSLVESATKPERNYDTGNVTEQYIDIEMQSIPQTVTEKEVAKSDGFLQIGDVYFHLKVKDFTIDSTTYKPKQTDQLIDNGKTYSVIDVQLDTSRLKYKILCRKYK